MFYFLLFQRRMSSDISPSLVNWMTSMMTMRLQVILEHIPITEDQIQNYIVHTQVRKQPYAFRTKKNHLSFINNNWKNQTHKPNVQ